MKKRTLILALFFSTIQFLLSQQKIYFGTESGLSVGYINMGIPKTKTVGFQNIFTFALAPTGFSLAKEWKDKWMIETGVYMQTIVNQGYGFVEEWAPGRTDLLKKYSQTDAISFSFKMLRFYPQNKKVVVSPHIGIRYCAINQFNSLNENFNFTNVGASNSNGIEVNDTTRSSILYSNNNFLAIELGIRTWFKLNSRSFLTFDVNYFTNPYSAISYETLTYKKEGKPAIVGYSVHKARNLFFQIGFRWHWKDLHSVK